MAESIVFYKLQSKYPEDITKNCKLTLTEMDGNFLTLKDHDISGGTYDASGKTLYITRNNGENIAIDLSELSGKTEEIIHEIEYKTPNLDLSGNYKDGKLNITLGYSGDPESYQSISIDNISGGTTIIVHDIERIYHDATFKGEGTKESPFKQVLSYQTNSYKPCWEIVTSLPEQAVLGDRYILNESVDNIGYLYNSDILSYIKEGLDADGGMWRIPTNEDWDKLLNYCEVYEEQKTHGEDGPQGGTAAYELKSKTGWSNSEDTYGFGILPCPYISTDGILTSELTAGFWIDSEQNKVKTFDDNNQVFQFKDNGSGYYSIRLVSDNPSDSCIFGRKYPFVFIEGIGQYWTTINLNYEVESDGCKKAGSEFASSHTQYSIAEYNGASWDKAEVFVGDKVSTSKDNTIVEYVVGEGHLIQESKTTYLEDGSSNTYVDAGWY